MDTISISESIVSVTWLKEHLGTKNLIVLDATINKNLDVSNEQIPKGRFFDIKKKFSDVSNAFPSAFPSVKQFTKEAQELGINKNSAIVVYDDKGIYSSARVWWLFKAMGHNNVAVLNGGFPEWKKSGCPIEPMAIYKGPKGDFVSHLQPDYMKFFQDVKVASKNKTHKIIDARSKERFLSLVDEPREGLRRGNIPNSINLPFEDLITGNMLKEANELELIFSAVVEKDDPIIFSCGSGITACVLALGAELTGHKNMAVYDGSWTEWGSLVSE